MARNFSLFLAVSVVMALHRQSHGDVVLASNLGEGYGGTTYANRGNTLTDGTFLAQAFTSGGQNIQLTKIFLKLQLGVDTVNSDAQVDLYSGSPGGTLVSTLNGSIGEIVSNCEFTPGGTVNLLAGTTYWVQVKTIHVNTSINWGYTASLSGDGPGYITDSGSYNIATNAWSFTTAQPFYIEVQAVPEPGTFLMGIFATSGAAGGWWFRRKRKVVGI